MRWFGLDIPRITRAEALQRLPLSRVIFTPNPEILLELSRNAGFLPVLSGADLLLPDGHGLQIVSTVRLYPKWIQWLILPWFYFAYLFRISRCASVYPEIIHGSDFMKDLLQYSEAHGLRVFFLGGAEGVAESASRQALVDFPHLECAGASSLDPNPAALVALEEAKPDVVLVAYGAPKQEIFIHQAAQTLPFVQHFMGVGGSFDYYSGYIQRAPHWMQSLGLEWLYRLLKEPRKRALRIWNALIVFPIKSVFSSDC